MYAAMGQTNAGRYLIVFFIYKKIGVHLFCQHGIGPTENGGNMGDKSSISKAQSCRRIRGGQSIRDDLLCIGP